MAVVIYVRHSSRWVKGNRVLQEQARRIGRNRALRSAESSLSLQPPCPERVSWVGSIENGAAPRPA